MQRRRRIPSTKPAATSCASSRSRRACPRAHKQFFLVPLGSCRKGLSPRSVSLLHTLQHDHFDAPAIIDSAVQLMMSILRVYIMYYAYIMIRKILKTRQTLPCLAPAAHSFSLLGMAVQDRAEAAAEAASPGAVHRAASQALYAAGQDVPDDASDVVLHAASDDEVGPCSPSAPVDEAPDCARKQSLYAEVHSVLSADAPWHSHGLAGPFPARRAAYHRELQAPEAERVHRRTGNKAAHGHAVQGEGLASPMHMDGAQSDDTSQPIVRFRIQVTSLQARSSHPARSTLTPLNTRSGLLHSEQCIVNTSVPLACFT